MPGHPRFDRTTSSPAIPKYPHSQPPEGCGERIHPMCGVPFITEKAIIAAANGTQRNF